MDARQHEDQPRSPPHVDGGVPLPSAVDDAAKPEATLSAAQEEAEDDAMAAGICDPAADHVQSSSVIISSSPATELSRAAQEEAGDDLLAASICNRPVPPVEAPSEVTSASDQKASSSDDSGDSSGHDDQEWEMVEHVEGETAAIGSPSRKARSWWLF
ncbi:hypothetical protein LTR53_009300 [Teratosphaeriaceae sp. CCFEE 6253]|nr:hypothetical protein LTR53_009300 [Teratosphaeriaceae sp. CCFEE 6253]